jgi:rubredoxin
MDVNQAILMKYWRRLKENGIVQEMLEELRARNSGGAPLVALPLDEDMERTYREATGIHEYRCHTCGAIFDISEHHEKIIVNPDTNENEGVCACPICESEDIINIED